MGRSEDRVPGRLTPSSPSQRSSNQGTTTGLPDRPTLWPKLIWARLYERWRKASPENMHVVFYRRIAHARHLDPHNAPSHGLVAPLRLFRALRYWNLERFADAVVEVPDGTTRAVVRPGPARGR